MIPISNELLILNTTPCYDHPNRLSKQITLRKTFSNRLVTPLLKTVDSEKTGLYLILRLSVFIT